MVKSILQLFLGNRIVGHLLVSVLENFIMFIYILQSNKYISMKRKITTNLLKIIRNCTFPLWTGESGLRII